MINGRENNMKGMSRYFTVGIILLCAAAIASVALARGGGGGRGGGRGGPRGSGASGNLCLSGSMLDLSLSRVDLLVRTTGNQKPALDELKKAATEYSDNMSRACAGDTPMDIPAKLAAADKRLDTALAGVRKLKPAVEKFYATLSDEQKG